MAKQYFIFEVETFYKNGKTMSETITATCEDEMWNIYDEDHAHEIELINNSAIVDSWVQ